MTRGSGQPASPDLRAGAYLAAALAGGGAIVAVEALLVAPGHLIAAQVIDALLVLVLVNAGPWHETSGLTPPAAAALAALRALALVPLIRVVGMGLPMRDWSEPLAVLAIAVSVGFVALRLAPLVGMRLRRLFDLRPALPDLYAVLVGLELGLVAYVAGAPALWPEGAADNRIALGLAAGIAAACCEELVFRGLVQGTFQRAAGRAGMLAAAAIFAATYLDSGSAALVLTMALAGVAFGHVMSRTGAIRGPIAGHVILVIGAGAVWPALLDGARLPVAREPHTTLALSIAIAIAAAAACWKPGSALSPRTGDAR